MTQHDDRAEVISVLTKLGIPTNPEIRADRADAKLRRILRREDHSGFKFTPDELAAIERVSADASVPDRADPRQGANRPRWAPPGSTEFVKALLAKGKSRKQARARFRKRCAPLGKDRDFVDRLFGIYHALATERPRAIKGGSTVAKKIKEKPAKGKKAAAKEKPAKAKVKTKPCPKCKGTGMVKASGTTKKAEASDDEEE